MKSNKITSTTTKTMTEPYKAWFDYIATPKDKYILGVTKDGEKIWSTDNTAGWEWKHKTGSGWTVTISDRDLRYMMENNITWHELQQKKWEEPELPRTIRIFHYVDIPLTGPTSGYRMY